MGLCGMGEIDSNRDILGGVGWESRLWQLSEKVGRPILPKICNS